MAKDNSGFFDRVYDVARQIPYGRVTSYGAIAKALGAAGSARMVGWAMNNAGNFEDVPAHRVLNRNGLLTGKHHFPGTNLMQKMLEEEGIIITDDKVQDFKTLFWDPVIELGLLDDQ
ncbi:MGMT family protein [Flavimarina sp. Hel_I_48]|uniref:MGMT family protein n=1 Tax=Flavimarina sp. Hel_I_48 TaxID=1392488 RepID=UPI0004DFAA3C|nr:MGMT family protein [Flavimarina sp. Hel_I_48]